MARFLLNTNLVIAALLGSQQILDKLARLPVGDVAISALSFGELLAGAATAGPDARLTENLALISGNFDILAFDRVAAETYGGLMKRLDMKRRKMLDRMIAAHALSIGATLVTTGADDFEYIPGLKVEIWPV